MTGEFIRVAIVESDRPEEFATAMRQVSSLECGVVVPRRRLNSESDQVRGVTHVLDLEQLLHDSLDAFDVAIVDSPLASRATAAVKIAKRGKSICVSLPPAASLGHWHELSAALHQTDAKWIVANPFRMGSYVKTIHESLQSGKLGAPGLLRIHSWTRQPASDQLDESSVLELAAAQLDVACWLFDDRPNSVYAVALQQAGQVNQGIQIHLGFADGGMAQIGCVVAPNSDPYSMVTLVGSRGAVYADDHHNMNLLIHDRTESTLVGQGVDGLSRQLTEIIDCEITGNPHGCTASDVENVYRVTQAVVECLDAGRSAKWTGERYELS